jgi:hypothetical protein
MGMGTDDQILKDVLTYKKRFDYSIFVETGTYAGTTSKIVSKYFEKVYTCDVSEDEAEAIEDKFKDVANINFMLADSRDALPKFLTEIGNDKFFLFLDAHWHGYFPVLDELQIVADFGYKPFIFIHDFDCGHDGWGFDCGDQGECLNFDYVKEKIEAIYGIDGYVFEVSQFSNNESNGSGLPNLRGCGFFYPKN